MSPGATGMPYWLGSRGGTPRVRFGGPVFEAELVEADVFVEPVIWLNNTTEHNKKYDLANILIFKIFESQDHTLFRNILKTKSFLELLK